MFNWIQSKLFSPDPQTAIDYPQNVTPKGNEMTKIVPVSVNYFPHRKCNYSCEFCFHTSKNLYILPLPDALRGLRLMAQAGMKKLNISGGEPFLKPEFLGEVFKFCKEELHIESCSVVSNGSKVTEKWLDTYGQYLDIMAISCDSFDVETSLKLGRAEKGQGTHIGRVFLVADWCRDRGIKVKINSVVTRLNFQEDMNESIEAISPYRWKVFQVLILDGENSGDNESLRDARNLTITDEEFKYFLERHAGQKCLVPEDNLSMKDSYLSLDEEMRFLNCQAGGKTPGPSILKVGVQEAMKYAGFDDEAFVARGGIFEWSRDKGSSQVQSVDW